MSSVVGVGAELDGVRRSMAYTVGRNSTPYIVSDEDRAELQRRKILVKNSAYNGRIYRVSALIRNRLTGAQIHNLLEDISIRFNKTERVPLQKALESIDLSFLEQPPTSNHLLNDFRESFNAVAASEDRIPETLPVDAINEVFNNEGPSFFNDMTDEEFLEECNTGCVCGDCRTDRRNEAIRRSLR